MWLEAMYASMSIAGVCGVTLGINALFPAETKRFLRIVRAEIAAKIPMKRKRPTVELALHAGVEVDIKWWDEEFAKLERAIPTASWSEMVGDLIREVEASFKFSSLIKADSAPPGKPTLEDFRRWHASGIKQVTEGNVTYYVDNTVKSYATLSNGESVMKFRDQMLEFERVKLDNVRANPHRSDATPPGQYYSLREAQAAGISLEVVQSAVMKSFTDEPRAKGIPRDISVKMRQAIDVASSYNSLIAAVVWGNLMLEKHGHAPAEDCEFCEYEEISTYASRSMKRYKTSLCWECQGDKDERLEKVAVLSRQAIMTSRGIYSPSADTPWNIL